MAEPPRPESGMEGTICKYCKKLISKHLPEQLEDCIKKQKTIEALKGDGK